MGWSSRRAERGQQSSLWPVFSLPPLGLLPVSPAAAQALPTRGLPRRGSGLPGMGEKQGPSFPVTGSPTNGAGEGVGSLTSLPLARAKPPPRRITIFQGIFFFTISQVRRAGGAFSFPGFPTPQAEEGGSPGANRLSLPSPPPGGSPSGLDQSLMHGREGPSVLPQLGFVPESLCPWQVSPASLGWRLSARRQGLPRGPSLPQARCLPGF